MSKYVIVDLEMCNVPKGSKREEFSYAMELIEIGAVLLNDTYEIADRFKTYVSPEFGVINPYIQKLTKITKADTAGAPSTKEALELFAEWLPEDVILVSWSDNDERQIRKEMELKNIESPALEKRFEVWEDCQKTFGEKMNTLKCYALQEALNIANIDYNENIHDALVDAENTAMLFAKMKNDTEWKLNPYYNPQNDVDVMYSPMADLLRGLGIAVQF